MVAVTFGFARVAARAVAGTKTGKKGKSFFARVYDAIIESQMKRAERDIALYRHLLPPDFEMPKYRSRSEDRTPFGGW
ncbi:MAG: hypothetical protein EXR03_01785 [Pseudolabrys sp.]|nr:hypothetical protein [Pseudolabrys sp.]MSP31538.1 hypothetical protein [Pseudolabrys sp.]